MKIKFYPYRTSKPAGSQSIISGDHFLDLMDFTKTLLCSFCNVDPDNHIGFKVDNGSKVMYFHYSDNRLYISKKRKDWEKSGTDYPEIEI